MPVSEKGVPPRIRLNAVVLDCPDVAALSDFYVRFLGWKRGYAEGDEWAEIVDPSSGAKIAFQKNEDYLPPVWPEEPGKQQQMLHLDFIAEDESHREAAVRHAIACGAARARKQYSDAWTVMLDPVGHPFCIVV